MNYVDVSKVDNTPRGIALRLIHELTEIIPQQGQLMPSDLKAYEAFYNRVEAQPEPVQWLFAYELQYLMGLGVEAIRQMPEDQTALLKMTLPRDLSMFKNNCEFVKKTLGDDESFRNRFMRAALRKLPDVHPLNPDAIVKIYRDEKCPDATTGNISAPVSKPS